MYNYVAVMNLSTQPNIYILGFLLHVNFSNVLNVI